MGILSDFFIAAPEQLTEDRLRVGPDGTYPTVQSKSFTEVEMGELLQVVRHGNVDAAVPHRDEFPLILTYPGEESWVVACPSELRDALAGASEGDLVDYAARWAAAEQLKFVNNDEATLISVLNELAPLVRLAQARNESLCLWMSV